MRLAARLLCLGLLLSLLAGCGFQLRQADPQDLPWRLDIRGLAAEDPLARRLQAWSAADGHPATLEFARADWQRRVLSVGSDGKAVEYELRYVLRFRLLGPGGQTLLPWQGLDLRTDYAFDPAQVLAKGREAELLRQDLRDQASRAIARQLRQLAGEARP